MEKVAEYKHSDFVTNLIIENNCKKVLELGVYEGWMTKRVLDHLKGEIIEEYWAVDRWKTFDNPSYRDWATWGQEVWDAKYIKTCTRMLYFPALKVIRANSQQAATIFPDGYFDLVYIDADHQYEGVKADLVSWVPKVRDGGVIAGHDYLDRDGRGKRSRCEVKSAVIDFFGEGNFNEAPFTVWWKYK